jgi:serine/threonine protein kinase
VKIIEKKSLDTLSLQNLIRELLVLGGLTHDHIVPLLQVIDSPDQIYMVMEMETGGELFSYIVDKGKLSEDESVYIFRQIISAVDYFHSQDIVHRDLKPENSKNVPLP